MLYKSWKRQFWIDQLIKLPLKFVGMLLLYSITQTIIFESASIFTQKKYVLMHHNISALTMVLVLGILIIMWLFGTFIVPAVWRVLENHSRPFFKAVIWEIKIIPKRWQFFLKKWKQLLQNPAFLRTLFLTWFVMLMCMGILMNVTQQNSTANQDELDAILKGALGQKIALNIIAIVVAPIFEENIFRHLVVQSLFKYEGYLPDSLLDAIALIVSACSFGLFHQPANFVEFFLYSMMGAFMFWMYRRYGLEGSVSLHMLNNTVASVGSLFALGLMI